MFIIFSHTFSCSCTVSKSHKGLSHIFNIRIKSRAFSRSSDKLSSIRLQLRKTYCNFFICHKNGGIFVKWLLFKFKCMRFVKSPNDSGNVDSLLFSNVSQRSLLRRLIDLGKLSKRLPRAPKVSRHSQLPISSGNVNRPVLLHQNVSSCVSWPISRGNEEIELQLIFKAFRFVSWQITNGNSVNLLKSNVSTCSLVRVHRKSGI